ncbi:FAD-dependent thymidylate synthase [Clostridium butyricum]|uniref:FAD-dependent thymidylate synthase n=1 Tax=Clostridium butyricum TaxID=1492 RepID=UPI00374F7945
MKIIKPYIITDEIPNGTDILNKLEKIGRVCYKSEDKICKESAEKFIGNIIKRGHESVIEHVSISVRVICDRGVTHEIVRHRLASYSQESTRYCNYSSDKFGSELTFIRPCFWSEASECYKIWENSMLEVENNYMKLINSNATPQEARSILPNSIKTEIVMTMNLREWRHFFKLRMSSAAHPQMQEVAKMIFKELKKKIPVIFDDFE